ncbi:MAG: cation-translocating P-type ATPase [Caldilineaceae bacterium]|nr:cation-translocating P-type ATPase [Caldilineaceae bacterium]
MPLWYQLSITDTLTGIKTDPARGLTQAEVNERLQTYGPNELEEQGGRSPWKILWEQLTATMVLILVAAAVISGALGKWNEAIAILAIVLLFAFLGFFQEYRAERAMAALKKLAVPNVRARREGTLKEIPARELVPGDLVLLEAGNLVPADLRLLESINLRIQEAALTGEAEAVEKQVELLEEAELPLGDRSNMAYMGTTVTYGRGLGVVTSTGMNTELGHIANLLQQSEEGMTPLQKRLDQVGKVLAVIGVVIAALVAAIDLFNGSSLVEAFLVAVSVAVAVVPEGLPAVVTITLALGARRMLARNALIRKLPAVETLGSVTTICSDKTGTLTENRMTVTVLDVAGHRADLTEETTASGQLKLDLSQPATATPEGSIGLLLIGGALCNDAKLTISENGSQQPSYHAIGDPTEGALVVAAAKFGILKEELDNTKPRVAELPFDSDRKRMTTVHALAESEQSEIQTLIATVAPGAPYLAFTKGSVDGLLDISSHVWTNGARVPMSDAFRQRIEEANRSLAENGMRVLGVAFKTPDTASSTPELEHELTFVGFVGIIDPPRAEVKEAVAKCKSAGIRPVMITGDHPLTALHIAKELGIAKDGDRVVTGVELNTMKEEALDALVEQVPVYARVSPEHKLRIVEALKRRGHVTAMTGDGVNDAPALKTADIGVAMGITGTDVSKEAAKMVLQDDNFSTIVAAVEEGRVIYDNLRKFIKFSISGNIGKVLVMLVGVLLGMSSPLLPLQLLWLNLLTDGLLGIGLGVEPGERNLMRRKPISPQAGIFSDGVGSQIIRFGLLIGALSLGIGAWRFFGGHANWQTMMFTTLAFAQVWQAIGTRSGNDSLFKAGLFSNIPLLGLSLLVVGAQLAALYLPTLQTFLATYPLSVGDLLLCFAVSFLVFVYAEVEKIFLRPQEA